MPRCGSFVLGISLLTLVAAVPALAGPLESVSQFATVTASVQSSCASVTVTDSDNASDLSPLTASATVEAEGCGTAYATANQGATFAGQKITGSVSAQGAPPLFGATVSASATLDIVFDVTYAVPWELIFYTSASVIEENTSLTFSGPGGLILSYTNPGTSGIIPWGALGPLTPGQHQLSATVDLSDWDDFHSPFMNFTFIVPEPASFALVASGLLGLCAMRSGRLRSGRRPTYDRRR